MCRVGGSTEVREEKVLDRVNRMCKVLCRVGAQRTHDMERQLV